MKSPLVFVLVLFMAYGSSAQSKIRWKGGTHGKETAWDCPSNWDKGRIPRMSDRVVVHRAEFSPVLAEGAVRIHQLSIKKGGMLCVKKDALLIVNAGGMKESVVNLQGKLYNFGVVQIVNSKGMPLDHLCNYHGNGALVHNASQSLYAAN